MNETPFKFTSEEKEQTLQILERLRTAVGDTFKPGDEQHLREDIQHAFINHQIKRNVFGMNPILAALQTAEIAVNEIGLKRDGIIAILMQTSVIDGYQTIEDIQQKYGDSVAHIISGLLRIHDLYKRNPIIESENFRNLLISFSEDMRVILIMIADRVNVMRQIRDTDQKEAKHEVSEEASYLCCRKADIKELEDAELVIYLRKKLNRPMRVCGVVKNVGEPGGGPFLTYNQDGTVSLQILESSQIDKNNEEYMKMFTEGTHFNPVDLVCATKDYQGNAFDLPKFVDPSTGFISSKSKNGKDLKALELPGLWNGAMSDWNTVFVEVPLGTFNPVKTVNDLLRDQHQAVEGGIKHEHHHEHGEGGCCGKH